MMWWLHSVIADLVEFRVVMLKNSVAVRFVKRINANEEVDEDHHQGEHAKERALLELNNA